MKHPVVQGIFVVLTSRWHLRLKIDAAVAIFSTLQFCVAKVSFWCYQNRAIGWCQKLAFSGKIWLILWFCEGGQAWQCFLAFLISFVGDFVSISSGHPVSNLHHFPLSEKGEVQQLQGVSQHFRALKKPKILENPVDFARGWPDFEGKLQLRP